MFGILAWMGRRERQLRNNRSHLQLALASVHFSAVLQPRKRARPPHSKLLLLCARRDGRGATFHFCGDCDGAGAVFFYGADGGGGSVRGDAARPGLGGGGGRRSISVGTAMERAPFFPTARTAKK